MVGTDGRASHCITTAAAQPDVKRRCPRRIKNLYVRRHAVSGVAPPGDALVRPLAVLPVPRWHSWHAASRSPFSPWSRPSPVGGAPIAATTPAPHRLEGCQAGGLAPGARPRSCQPLTRNCSCRGPERSCRRGVSLDGWAAAASAGPRSRSAVVRWHGSLARRASSPTLALDALPSRLPLPKGLLRGVLGEFLCPD